jgi:hypothetical protein
MTETQITKLIQTMTMAKRWQRHGNTMATIHGIHTNDGNYMATPWQHHGNNMATTWQRFVSHTSTMAKSWQHHGNTMANILLHRMW